MQAELIFALNGVFLKLVLTSLGSLFPVRTVTFLNDLIYDSKSVYGSFMFAYSYRQLFL